MSGKLFLLTALFSAVALAQGGMGGGGGMGSMGGGSGMGGGGRQNGQMGDMGSGMPRGQRQSRFDQIADKLKLNKDQKEQAQNIFDAGREEAGPLRESIGKARLGIADAVLNNKSDEDVKKAEDAYSAEVAKLTGVEAKAFAKLYAILKPNQQSKAPLAWDLMSDIFTGGGRGAGRGRGQGQN
jgi:Spy/CpxP family protein refolding chaperone